MGTGAEASRWTFKTLQGGDVGGSAAKAVRDDVLTWSEQRAMNIAKFKTMPEAMQDLWPRPSANFLRETTWKILLYAAVIGFCAWGCYGASVPLGWFGATRDDMMDYEMEVLLHVIFYACWAVGGWAVLYFLKQCWRWMVSVRRPSIAGLNIVPLRFWRTVFFTVLQWLWIWFQLFWLAWRHDWDFTRREVALFEPESAWLTQLIVYVTGAVLGVLLLVWTGFGFMAVRDVWWGGWYTMRKVDRKQRVQLLESESELTV